MHRQGAALVDHQSSGDVQTESRTRALRATPTALERTDAGHPRTAVFDEQGGDSAAIGRSDTTTTLRTGPIAPMHALDARRRPRNAEVPGAQVGRRMN